ncbi:MAG: SUMF1/EgtB/PvdO family nonheme iron enzyme, partial [Lentisphaeria bacterium]|nr:SUMF1/EgtB/PvdO family nonheme iron enzyme [Lentisphaeria bacterium]
YKANSGDQTHQVGKKRANELGLHDMSGNVWEWCLDEIVISGPKSESAQGNDQVRLARARRGGGWGSVAEYCRIAERDSKDPGYRFYDLGFRLALVPVQ